MRTYPRIRKTVKWGGAVVCVMLLIAWGVSKIWWVAWSNDRWWISIDYGMMTVDNITLYRATPVPGFQSKLQDPEGPHPRGPRWSLESNRQSAAMPFWMLVLPPLAIAVVAFRLDTLARRRARGGLCLKCRYDRAGLASGAVCPECGTLTKS